MRINYLKYRKPVISGLVIIFIGTFLVAWIDLYKYFTHLDKIFHLSGGFVVAWFTSIYFNKEITQSSKFKKFIILTAAVCLVGVLWEFSEYISSVYFSWLPGLIKYVYIGDLKDTLGDLSADIAGGFILVLVEFLRLRK